MVMSRGLDKPAAYHFQMNTEVAVPSKILEPVNQTTCCQIQGDHITIQQLQEHQIVGDSTAPWMC